MMLHVSFTLRLEFVFLHCLIILVSLFLHELYYYLLGCFFASTNAIYAGTTVTVGQ